MYSPGSLRCGFVGMTRWVRPDLILIGVGLLISLFQLNSIFQNKTYIRYNDVFYYVSVGDSLRQTGRLEDLTSQPSQPVKTLQNGAAWIYAGLRACGLPSMASIQAFVILNYVLWIAAIPAFVGLINRVGICGRSTRAFLVFAFLTSHSVLTCQTIPGTDGVFDAGVLWLLLAFSKTVLPSDGSAVPLSTMQRRAWWIVMALLCAILIHFSVRLLFCLTALSFALVLTKASRKTVMQSLIPIAVAVLSLCVLVIAVDTSRIHGQAGRLVFGSLESLRDLPRVLMVYVSGEPWFPSVLVHSLALGSLVFFSVATLWGIRRKDFFSVAFGLTILISVLLLVVTLSPKVFGQAGGRYLMFTVPLAWLMVMRIRALRVFAMIGIMLIAFRTAAFAVRHSPPSNSVAFIDHLSQCDFRLPEDSILLSQYSRHTYVVLNGRSTMESSALALLPGQRVWICGDTEFRNRKHDELRASTALTIHSEECLTPDYRDTAGHALVDMTLQKVRSEENSRPIGAFDD